MIVSRARRKIVSSEGKSMPFEPETVELPTGATLDYVEQGDPSGVPVLLLHGLSDSWRSYELMLPHLPPSVRGFALSLRGHGESSRPAGAYRFRDFAADVRAFMDALDLDAAFLVGHSLGSAIVQRFALDHPDRTLGIVLVNSFHSLAKSPVSRELWPVVEQLDDPVGQDFVREFQESTITQPVPDTFLRTAVQESMKLPASVWRHVIGSAMQHDFSQELVNIEVPTLLVWGDQDAMIPRSEQDAQVGAIRNARLLVYEGAGHAVPWEQPERLASDVAAFIRP